MKPYSILVLITVFTFSNCIPTSVLANTKDATDQKNFKVKRSSIEKPIPVQQENSDNSKNSNNDINNGIQSFPVSTTNTNNNNNNNNNNMKSSQLNQNYNDKLHLKPGNELTKNLPDPIVSSLFMTSNLIKEKPAPHKRGVNSQFLYGNSNNNNNDGIELPSSLSRNYPNYLPNGVWGNELDPMTSMDFQDFDDYPARAQYATHSKPYENLQNILNAEPSISQYQSPIALPYSQYSPSYGYNRYYNERRKRSNKQHTNFDESIPEYTELELTPNELLALLAMIEAGALEKEQQPDSLWELNNNNKDYSSYSKPSYYDDHDEIGSFMIPNKLDENDFDPRYQIPVNFENIPRYEIYKDANKGGRSAGAAAKRFMVSKKKRSLGHLNYFNGPIGKPGISFSPIKGAKSIQKVI